MRVHDAFPKPYIVLSRSLLLGRLVVARASRPEATPRHTITTLSFASMSLTLTATVPRATVIDLAVDEPPLKRRRVEDLAGDKESLRARVQELVLPLVSHAVQGLLKHCQQVASAVLSST